jgi:hypothetical protein
MTKPLPEYENLTSEELEWADHCHDTCNALELKRLRELSASRANDKS